MQNNNGFVAERGNPRFLKAISTQQAQRDALCDMLITRARLEHYTETQYSALVELAREWVDVLA